MASSDGADGNRPGMQPDDRKTETTLTTRVRINIPGSRPIPPVVVRKPVGDAETADTAADEGTDAEATGTVRALGTLQSPPEPPAPAEEKPASDWFAPRKPAAATGPQGGGATGGTGLPGASGIQGPPSAPGAGARGANGASGAPTAPGMGGARPGAPGANGIGGARPDASGAPGAPGARPGGGPRGASAFGARPGATNGNGLPGAAGAGPVAPGHGGGTDSFDVSDAVAATTASFPVIGGDIADEPRRDDLPYFSEPGRPGPFGPTGGPVTGDGPVIPPGLSGPTPGGPGLAGPTPGGPGLTGPGGPGLLAPGMPGTPGGAPGGPLGPGAPGAAAGQGRPGGAFSDDTAILTPQKQAPEPGHPGFGGPGDNISGHTVSSGIPVVPPGAQIGAFDASTPADGSVSHTPPKLPDPPTAQNTAAAKPAKKKGRSKLVLLVGGLVVIAGGVYGAGLLMNRSDVPKGTTVLGVDIGGGTRDEAIQKLDATLGSRTTKPLQLSVDGKTVALRPDQAGLQLDSKATVAAAAGSDYNPVSVIGSLFGQQRVVQPAMPVDEEKLQAALERAAGGAGSMTEGSIKFESGKAVAVYGKAGKGIDVAGSARAVEEAYRTEVETGASTPVRVATTTRQPTIPNAEVDRMMKAFAEPAMSANIVVRADATHVVAFSPKNSLWKFLQVKAIDGKLVESYDKAALQNLYGHIFDGVLVTRGTGKKTPVTVEDVISAVRPALLGTTTATRVATIDTNPS